MLQMLSQLHENAIQIVLQSRPMELDKYQSISPMYKLQIILTECWNIALTYSRRIYLGSMTNRIDKWPLMHR